MLSPASLRVCCLAVMAPALTKADRQADCLPVVLSESFCIPKTPDTYNITARLSESPLKCAVASDYSHNKRKPFMHRACWRTQKSGSGVLCKYRTIGNDSSKSLLYINRVRTQKDTKHKTWLSTKAITAYAGKIKLKYTMNKNTSSYRNMGLAKANTSLGLQSLKKLKRFSKENQSSGPINVMDDSLTFSDSADSSVQIETVIEENTNSDSNVLPVDNDSVPCVSSNGRTSAVSDVLDTLNTVSESMVSDSQPFLSAGADEIEAMDSSTSVTLTDLLKSSVENPESSESPQILVSSLPCSVPVECTEDVMMMNNDVPEAIESTDDLQPEMSELTVEHSEPDIPLENDAVHLEPSVSKQISNSVFTKFSDFKLPILNSQYSGNPLKSSSFYSVINSSKLITNASRLSQVCGNQLKCPYIVDSRFGSNLLVPTRRNKDMCCLLSSQELESLRQTLNEKSSPINSAVSSSTRLLAKYLSAHVRKQLCSLVEHYQRSLQIPCQRPAKHASLKSSKHVVDVQTELLQNEEVKSMSTAELVKFVHEIKGTQTRTLATKSAFSTNVTESSDIVPLSFSPEDCEDIKHTSGVLLSTLKNVLRDSDPYLTESSDEEYESESEEEETAPSESETEVAESEDPLWKYLVNRMKLGSRSTFLLAKVHELEFKIKEYTERWNELAKAEGNVCFEESPESLSSPLLESDETSLRTAVKQTSLKNFLLPLNGFLDRNDASHIARDPLESELDSLKGSGPSAETDVCCRTRPLNTAAFRKRKIVYIPGLYDKSPKFSRSSTVNCICNCQSYLAPCILCTGQHNSIQSVDPESMSLRERLAILDPYFHPALSGEKDIPFGLHVDNVLKTEPKYNIRPPSPEPNPESEVESGIQPKYQDFRSHRKLSRYARSLSAKYRNKHHRTTKHLRKHKLVFGKWRRLQNKHALRARNRFRRHSIASSGSSPESTVNSPLSVYDDGLGFDNKKKRGDDSQFDIDDVIIPCSSRSGRLVEIQYKEIMIPSWRSLEDEELACETDDLEENITDAYCTKRHDQLEIEEKEKVKRTALGLNKRMRRNRCDSRADSSGANTPDPTSLYNNQDNVFQTPNYNMSAGPASPASPATPNSAVVSDDSQPPLPSLGNILTKKKATPVQKRTTEESTNTRNAAEPDEVPPFEPHQFPLSDEKYEELLAESEHNREVSDMPSNASSFPASPMSSSSSTSTVEDDEDDDEDDDVTDPEWTVVKPMRNSPEQALVLKLTKR